jgi:predicted adenine nucleotide alpha hydrolase (AANH) superfamily ATPase
MADMARRCPVCYDLRLARAASRAREHGFTCFSSTLLYSKYQNHQAILDAGHRHAGQGLDFLGEDFRPGWNEGVRLSKEWNVYRQPYCGCVLSEHDRYRKSILQKA